ncbi:unnamed protein product [Moneuplotes crassus]|uniref:Uncharacterized protein n=1 Tax=Euplotes crassus TaxID=5936 RepID=A0AAD1XAE2_EUPCR|nr:unnamed protein product [Moneuplotes crassus]
MGLHCCSERANMNSKFDRNDDFDQYAIPQYASVGEKSINLQLSDLSENETADQCNGDIEKLKRILNSTNIAHNNDTMEAMSELHNESAKLINRKSTRKQQKRTIRKLNRGRNNRGFAKS